MANATITRSELLACPECGAAVPVAVLNSDQPWTCRCGHTMQLWAFPAALGTIEGGRGAAAVIADEASCFYHAANQAQVPCVRCGRYVCAVCDIEISGAHYCPPCVEKANARGAITELKSRYALPDSLALRVAMVPFLVFAVVFLMAVPAPNFGWEALGVLSFMSVGMIGVFSAPSGIILSVRAYRNAEPYPVPRGAWRTHLALALSVVNLLLIAGGVILAVSLSMVTN